MPKRNAQGAGSIRQRPDGRWEARYTAGRNPGTGRQIQRSIYGATQKEVLQKLQEVHQALENGTYTQPTRMTVAQWLDIWAAEYLGGVKGSTSKSYEAHIKNHIKPALGAVKLQQLKPHALQTFYNNCQSSKNLSAKTIKNLHGVVHGALKQAVSIGYLRSNPADFVQLPRIERKEIHPMPEDVLPSFLEVIAGQEFERVFFVSVFTGMRKGEVLGLCWNDVDFEHGTVCIKQQLQKEKGCAGSYVLVSPKNDKPRAITPAADVMAALHEEKRVQAQRQLAAGSLWSNPDNLVFTNPLGRHLVPQTVYKHFKRIVMALGYPDLRFHDLRHTYAVNALRCGDDIKTVQGNLGHHTAAFTLDTYGHVTQQMKRDSADRMQQIIEQAKKSG